MVQIPRMDSSNLPSGAQTGLTQPQLRLDLSHYTEGEILTVWNIQKGRFITLDCGTSGQKAATEQMPGWFPKTHSAREQHLMALYSIECCGSHKTAK